MKRDLIALARNDYDLVVIGGGIYGACVAWEATLRGLSVALVEKADYGSATSANSLKVIHGGLRYLQHGDFRRARASIFERKTLMRIAPHLIHPLPVLIPTSGHGVKGKEILSLGLAINDLIGFDRNRRLDPQKAIARGRIISKSECLQLLPGLRQRGLTGGAIFYDAQVYNSERLPLAFLQSAAKAGADLANYVEVIGFLHAKDCVTGVRVEDGLSGERFSIRARTVVNTSGPWLDHVLGLLSGQRPRAGAGLAKAINLLTRPLFETYAVGISSQKQYQDVDAVINRGSRFLFVAPWRGRSLVGTEYIPYHGEVDALTVSEEEIQGFLDEVNLACPAANLGQEDVVFVHCGLVPISGLNAETGSVRLAKHYQIRDHRQEGFKGLISVLGVKYTTARHVAVKVLDRVFRTWGQKPTPSTSAITRLYGGDIADYEAYLQSEIDKRPCGLGEEMVRYLICNYGSAYPEVLRYLDQPAGESPGQVERLAVLKAEVLHAVRSEMAQKLTDVVLRRSELATAGHPGAKPLAFCAEVMGEELSWSQDRIRLELGEVNDSFNWLSGSQAYNAADNQDGKGTGVKLANSAV